MSETVADFVLARRPNPALTIMALSSRLAAKRLAPQRRYPALAAR
jgi:hypothetical protein